MAQINRSFSSLTHAKSPEHTRSLCLCPTVGMPQVYSSRSPLKAGACRAVTRCVDGQSRARLVNQAVSSMTFSGHSLNDASLPTDATLRTAGPFGSSAGHRTSARVHT